jgi:Glycosyl transferase family 2
MLSVVLPTHNAERLLVPTLAALVPGAVAGLIAEVIVADAGSRDSTAEIADAAGCLVIASVAALGPRLAAAATRARAPWLLFLRPGFVLAAEWTAVVRAFVDSGEGEAAVFRGGPVPAAGQSAMVEILALLRARVGRRPMAAQGLLIAKRRYAEVGGHREVGDTERDLIARLGRRLGVLDCGGRLLAGSGGRGP